MRYGTLHQGTKDIPAMKDDNEWIASLMRVYYNDMFNYGKTFTLDENIIKDSIREIFISLLQRRHTCSEILSAKFYFLRAVKNKILKALDNADLCKNKNALPRDYEFMYEFPVEKSFILRETDAQADNRLKVIASRLTQREKEVVYLKYYHLLDNAQIAELMSITRQSVYNLLYGSI